MATIKINQENFIKGRMSISRAKDPNDGNSMTTVGILETHDYIEEINTIESERYLLLDVDVYQEDFGTNDYNIKYSFNSGNLIIKEDMIPAEAKFLIELEEYKDEDKELFHSENFEEAVSRYYELMEQLGIEE